MPVTEKKALSVRGLDLPAEPSGLAMLEPSQLIPSVAGREPSAREVIELHQSFETLLTVSKLQPSTSGVQPSVPGREVVIIDLHS